MDHEHAVGWFQAEQESPGGWYLQARSLFAAAERLNPYKLPCRDDEDALSFYPEHDLLRGLAFENLLKGFIVLVRLELNLKPSLPVDCYSHRLEVLAARSECAELEITPTESAILARLSPYIEWAGCYPLPKKSRDMFVKAWGIRQHDAEQQLSQRILPILHKRAWIMKGGTLSQGGHKLFLKRPAEQ